MLQEDVSFMSHHLPAGAASAGPASAGPASADLGDLGSPHHPAVLGAAQPHRPVSLPALPHRRLPGRTPPPCPRAGPPAVRGGGGRRGMPPAGGGWRRQEGGVHLVRLL